MHVQVNVCSQVTFMPYPGLVARSDARLPGNQTVSGLAKHSFVEIGHEMGCALSTS